jgi:hyperosmotically inducible periplasmic protein
MIRRCRSAFYSLVLGGALCVPGSMMAFQNTQAPPDNTKVNKRDRKTTEPSADQAKNSKSDVDLMANIRRAIVKDKSLSTYAHNVKVVSEHGKVTLKGPVHSEDEKRTVEEYAKKFAGDGNVTSELTVKGDSK